MGAGWCYKPSCGTGFLWHVVDEHTTVKLAEVAHIIAAGRLGPRADAGASESQLTSVDNLVLLCPTCHTIVDRASEVFTLEVIREWKMLHEGRLREALGVSRCETREELNDKVWRLLQVNKKSWEYYGPESQQNMVGASNRSRGWKRIVLKTIIPNNAAIRALIRENQRLIATEEMGVVADFELHTQGLVDRHMLGELYGAPRFPIGMNRLFDPLPDKRL